MYCSVHHDSDQCLAEQCVLLSLLLACVCDLTVMYIIYVYVLYPSFGEWILGPRMGELVVAAAAAAAAATAATAAAAAAVTATAEATAAAGFTIYSSTNTNI